MSVGAHNDYGHPSPVLLAEMARLGVPLLRTDRDGDVAVVAHAGRPAAVVRGTRASTVGASGLAGPRRPRAGVGAGDRAGGAVGARCEDGCMAARTVASDDLPSPLPPVVLLVGDEELLVDRAISAVSAAARAPRTRRSPRANGWAARSRAPNCTSCSARRCSATRG